MGFTNFSACTTTPYYEAGTNVVTGYVAQNVVTGDVLVEDPLHRGIWKYRVVGVAVSANSIG